MAERSNPGPHKFFLNLEDLEFLGCMILQNKDLAVQAVL